MKQLKTGQSVFSSCCVAQLCGRDTQTPQISNSPTPESAEQKTMLQRDGEHEGVEKEAEEVMESNVRLFSGSHDKCVYCWNGQDGEQLWKSGLDSVVYSTPVACNLLLQTASLSLERELEPPTNIMESFNPRQHSDTSPTNWSAAKPDISTADSSTLPCVCACTTSGQVYILDALKGCILGSVRLPGEVFSSPVVVDNLIVVGCRDDCVYCIECGLQ